MADPVAAVYLSETFADISNPSTIYFSAPAPGYLRRVQLTLFNAITGSDSSVTVKIDNTTVGQAIAVVVSGSAKGTSFFGYFNSPVKQGSLIEVITDGASSTTAITPCTITIW